MHLLAVNRAISIRHSSHILEDARWNRNTCEPAVSQIDGPDVVARNPHHI